MGRASGRRSDGPLLVFGPRSTDYDFGPAHPLTPLRFGPSIDLLRHVGAIPGLAPEPASDDELLLCHTAEYLAAVRRFSLEPARSPSNGIGLGDNPPFPGMHEASAAVAGGSLRAMAAILDGPTEHAFHPGGGLHHAMPNRASGFCVYDDPALAIALARARGLRVLYVDLDVHHGDGVQAIFSRDPGVLTLSLHESGRFLFPGTGFVNELGEGVAVGTSLNVPFEPGSGETVWLAAARSLVPAVAAAFGPDVLVTQHGCDSHAWDPLAHLRVTTTAMAEAARLCDAVAHRWAGGRWLSTGGGGYAAYRVVPRAWSLVWLAGAHREVPASIPDKWRERWAGDAARFGDDPLPSAFLDEPNGGLAADYAQEAAEERSVGTVALAERIGLPVLVREAIARGWFDPLAPVAVPGPTAPPSGSPTVVRLEPGALDRLTVAPRVIAPADPSAVQALLSSAKNVDASVTAAVAGAAIVGLVVSAPSRPVPAADELLAVGVAPAYRGDGLGSSMLRAHLDDREGGRPMVATFTVAERDPVEPLEAATRAAIARRLLESAGFRVRTADPPLGAADPWAVTATLQGDVGGVSRRG